MAKDGLSTEERKIRQKLKDDLPHFAGKALKLRAKSGELHPFIFNEAQLLAHRTIEGQLAKLGRVRALILKARQQGVSTYIAGRFYHKTIHRIGFRTHIAAHEQPASNNLFEMVERFQENMPRIIQPKLGVENSRELTFSDLDSGYRVSTAGNKGTGRSATVQLFHGSEVAFWPNAETHLAGIGQAIPELDDTEVILESTANGVGGPFHQMWQAAEAGDSDYIPIFIPWFVTSEYRRPVAKDWQLSEEEAKIKAQYNLDDEQMAWRRFKIEEMRDPLLFQQEYPATAADAFVVTGADPFIKPTLVIAARKCTTEGRGALVIGVDPARFGKDRTAICWRQGRKVIKIEAKSKLDTMETVGWVGRIIADDQPARVFVDVGGLGAGVVDRLRELGHNQLVEAVNFGGRALEPERYPNRRAEMWGTMKEWFEEPPVQIPDEDEIHGDITGPGYTYDSLSRPKIEKKEDMMKRGIRSPDMADALALTFAMPVVEAGVFNKPLVPNIGTIV